jgi:hypothetical protein
MTASRECLRVCGWLRPHLRQGQLLLGNVLIDLVTLALIGMRPAWPYCVHWGNRPSSSSSPSSPSSPSGGFAIREMALAILGPQRTRGDGVAAWWADLPDPGGGVRSGRTPAAADHTPDIRL